MYTNMLFVPGDSERKQEKCASVDADVFILDLEDSVAASKKQEAREITASALESTLPKSKKRYVRVNAFDTGLAEDDLKAVMPKKPDGIVLPKCCGVADVKKLSGLLDDLEDEQNAGQTVIVAIVTETPKGVLSLTRDDWSHPRLEGIMWGAEDLAAEIGAFRNYGNGTYTEPFRLVRNLCLLAARAAGVMPIDTVFADFRDMDALEKHTQEAMLDGFDAKAAIHPAQIEVIAKAFTPDPERVEWAQKVNVAFANADAGVAGVDGKMLDLPHLKMAERILSRVRN